jgi:hypothetical protein
MPRRRQIHAQHPKGQEGVLIDFIILLSTSIIRPCADIPARGCNAQFDLVKSINSTNHKQISRINSNMSSLTTPPFESVPMEEDQLVDESLLNAKDGEPYVVFIDHAEYVI